MDGLDIGRVGDPQRLKVEFAKGEHPLRQVTVACDSFPVSETNAPRLVTILEDQFGLGKGAVEYCEVAAPVCKNRQPVLVPCKGPGAPTEEPPWTLRAVVVLKRLEDAKELLVKAKTTKVSLQQGEFDFIVQYAREEPMERANLIRPGDAANTFTPANTHLAGSKRQRDDGGGGGGGGGKGGVLKAPPSPVLYVMFPFGRCATEQELSAAMSSFGPIRLIRTLSGKSVAFVHFADTKCAEEALRAFRRYPLFNDPKIRIEFSKTNEADLHDLQPPQKQQQMHHGQQRMGGPPPPHGMPHGGPPPPLLHMPPMQHGGMYPPPHGGGHPPPATYAPHQPPAAHHMTPSNVGGPPHGMPPPMHARPPHAAAPAAPAPPPAPAASGYPPAPSMPPPPMPPPTVVQPTQEGQWTGKLTKSGELVCDVLVSDVPHAARSVMSPSLLSLDCASRMPWSSVETLLQRWRRGDSGHPPMTPTVMHVKAKDRDGLSAYSTFAYSLMERAIAGVVRVASSAPLRMGQSRADQERVIFILPPASDVLNALGLPSSTDNLLAVLPPEGAAGLAAAAPPPSSSAMAPPPTSMAPPQSKDDQAQRLMNTLELASKLLNYKNPS